MTETTQSSQNFEFLFEAAAEGLELQKQIRLVRDIAWAATTDAIHAKWDQRYTEGPSDSLDFASKSMEAISARADKLEFEEELANKEEALKEYTGAPVSVRVLESALSQPIRTAYYPRSLYSSGRLEFSVATKNERKGLFRTALLGQNVLLLYPRLGLDQADRATYMVPILRHDGEPNIAIESRASTWRDSFGPRAQKKYAAHQKKDLADLKRLASCL